MSDPKRTYRERRMARAERLRGWAESRDSKAEAVETTARDKASVIPFGQPILAGHHSEGRDRRYRDSITRGFDKAHEHRTMARRHASRADEIERQAERAIYSDDPDAVDRLRARIAELEAERDAKKQANRDYKKTGDLACIPDQYRADAESAFAHWPGGTDVPFPSLKNLSANIRRQKQRLAQLET